MSDIVRTELEGLRSELTQLKAKYEETIQSLSESETQARGEHNKFMMLRCLGTKWMMTERRNEQAAKLDVPLSMFPTCFLVNN